MNDSSFRHFLIIAIVSLGLLMMLSALPLARLSDNMIKDFNLFEDLFPERYRALEIAETVEADSELAALLAEEAETTIDAVEADTTSAPVCEEAADKALAEAPVVDGVVCMENYTDGAPLAKFRQALASGNARIAVMGDSFIEGDIFCEDLREMLQQRYGGNGVGHVALHSEFPGFRKSVRQTSSGWTLRDIRTMVTKDSLRQISGDYCIASGVAKTTFKGTSYGEGTVSWNRSSFTFIAHASGCVTLTTDAGSQKFEIEAGDAPRTLSVNGMTAKFEIESDVPGLIGLGASLDGDGISLDCLSIRGNSGVAHSRINSSLCHELRAERDYNLIILEFGINALSAEQTNYSAYRLGMERVIAKLKSIYADADIIVMGISDRGAKEGSVVTSLSTCRYMVEQQRRLAVNAKCVFWDTRAAMGGANSVRDWKTRGLVNADYIHLNHKGGKELATLFNNALTKILDE